MVLHYPKHNATEDDDWLDIPIPETYVTIIKDDFPHTVPVEGLEWRELSYFNSFIQNYLIDISFSTIF